QLRTFFLPAYAPELNPVEYVWSHCKMNPLANLAVHEVTDLAVVARRSSVIVLFFCVSDRTLLMQ
ncbi:MAG TPA: transposase, partial [Candidatus Angelobacter sp.]